MLSKGSCFKAVRVQASATIKRSGMSKSANFGHMARLVFVVWDIIRVVCRLRFIAIGARRPDPLSSLCVRVIRTLETMLAPVPDQASRPLCSAPLAAPMAHTWAALVAGSAARHRSHEKFLRPDGRTPLTPLHLLKPVPRGHPSAPRQEERIRERTHQKKQVQRANH